MNDEELERGYLDRALRGETAAFRALYEHHADRVFHFLRRILGDRASAEDALQETFLRVLRGLGGWKAAGPASLGTWILIIARRVALTRELSRERARRREEVAGGARLLSVRPDETGDLRQALEAAVAALPLEQRTVFVLREWQGLSYEEIAAVVVADLGTVKSRLYRARIALQASLRDYLSGTKGSARERHVNS
jgi:RNA polymerase sigma factor (sigma-70 family)